jgi:hypothetical protein
MRGFINAFARFISGMTVWCGWPAPKRPSRPADLVESSHPRSLAVRGERRNHTIYFCELLRVTVRVNVRVMQGLREAMRPSLLSVDFPRLSYGINVLTQILLPCVAWRCVEVERAMGIEPTGKAVLDLEN